MNDDTINQLQRDIGEMESIVLYYQNRIARKRIALEEIVQGLMANEGKSVEFEPVIPKPEEPAPPPTVLQMVQGVADTFNGRDIDYKGLREQGLAKHPEHDHKLRTGFYGACVKLIAVGKKIQMPKVKQSRMVNRLNH